jgi:hypothetical protein
MKRQKNIPTDNGTILLVLCAGCAQKFRDTGEHIVRRADPKQKEMDTCNLCNTGRGWDYYVKNRGGVKHDDIR